jgi:hypothetical protein
MKETTLTHDNLIQIYKAMEQITFIDRSTYFFLYFTEIQDRLDEITFLNKSNQKNDRNKQVN